MMEAIANLLVSIPAAWAGYSVGMVWAYPRGRHEIGVSARRVCARQGRPVRARRERAHAV